MSTHTTIRTTAAAILIAAAAAVALAPATAAHTVRPATPDQGCSLFVSIPNPCEPDSAN